MFLIVWKRFIAWTVCVGACIILPPMGLAGDEPATSMRDWIPPTAADWTSLGKRLEDAYQQAKKENPKVGGGVLWAPLVSVDRTDGRLFAFPQGGAL